MLTYLIRESVITDQVSAISDGIVTRNLAQTALTTLALLAVFGFIVFQIRRNSRLNLEKQTFEAETRVKQEEMERRLALQEQLLEQEKQRAQQDLMITALASDYRSVYYVDLESDEAICYQPDVDVPKHPESGDHFPFHESFAEYARTT